MKILLLLCLVAATVAEEPQRGYHDLVGIPLANRIREAELARTQSGSRIVGGQPAPLGAHPYLVGVVVHMEGGVSACGSSMLSNTKVITAAHCWNDGWRKVDLFTLVFGSEYIFVGGIRVDTDNVDMHPEWDTASIANDLAIATFPWVSYTDVIQPIALPTGQLWNEDFAGVFAQASGYGVISDSTPVQPNQVQSHVTLQVITNEACRQQFGSFVRDSNLCTSGRGLLGPVGVCASDSGGPLSTISNGQRVLIGVVSFGSGQCEGGQADVFSRITSYVSWIQSKL